MPLYIWYYSNSTNVFLSYTILFVVGGLDSSVAAYAEAYFLSGRKWEDFPTTCVW